MTPLRQIRRDPIARETLLREVIDGMERTCSYCGSKREDGKLFVYYTEPDSVRPRRVKHHGEFCSKSCHDSYHD